MKDSIKTWLIERGSQSYKVEHIELIQSQVQLEHAENSVEKWKFEVQKLKLHCEVLKNQLPEKKMEATKKSVELAKSLAKHKAFDSCEIVSNVLKIKTKLLFTDIRKEEGSKEMVSCCIGAFEITIPSIGSSPSDVHIKNLLFDMEYAHWGIHNRVCWGEWEQDVHFLLRKDDLYGLFNLCTQLLRESILDGAAYMRSHVWRNQRILLSRNKITINDYVVCVMDMVDGLQMRGKVGMMLDASIASWKEGNFTWAVPLIGLRKITREQYDNASVYDFSQKRIKNPIEKLDNMDGGTREDAFALIEKIESQKIKLSPKKIEKTIAPDMKFKIGDIVKLLDARYICEPVIPRPLLEHGINPLLQFGDCVGKIMLIYKNYYIIKYKNSDGSGATLGFEEKSLELL